LEASFIEIDSTGRIYRCGWTANSTLFWANISYDTRLSSLTDIVVALYERVLRLSRASGVKSAYRVRRFNRT